MLTVPRLILDGTTRTRPGLLSAPRRRRRRMMRRLRRQRSGR